MIQRRSFGKIFAGAASLFGLSACAALTGSGVPLLQDVRTWVQLLAQQLPTFVNDSITAGSLTGAAAANAEKAVALFEQLATQFLDATASGVQPVMSQADIAKLISEILTAIGTILAVIPATASYAPLVKAAAAIFGAFLASTPLVQPAVPAKADLSRMHMLAARKA